jgi:hypothetical protein
MRSAWGHSRRFEREPGTSALPPTPDIGPRRSERRDGPQAEVSTDRSGARGWSPERWPALRAEDATGISESCTRLVAQLSGSWCTRVRNNLFLERVVHVRLHPFVLRMG